MHMNDDTDIDEAEARRIYCQFCGMLFIPVVGRVPSLACSNCWLEIQAEIQRETPQ